MGEKNAIECVETVSSHAKQGRVTCITALLHSFFGCESYCLLENNKMPKRNMFCFWANWHTGQTSKYLTDSTTITVILFPRITRCLNRVVKEVRWSLISVLQSQSHHSPPNAITRIWPLNITKLTVPRYTPMYFTNRRSALHTMRIKRYTQPNTKAMTLPSAISHNEDFRQYILGCVKGLTQLRKVSLRMWLCGYSDWALQTT